MLDDARCLRSKRVPGHGWLVMRKEDKPWAAGRKFRRRYVAPEGNHACGWSGRKGGVVTVEWQEQQVIHKMEDLPSFYMLCPLAAFVTDSAYFQPEIQLSEVPISIGQEEGSPNRRTSMFFSSLSNTWVRILDTAGLDMRVEVRLRYVFITFSR